MIEHRCEYRRGNLTCAIEVEACVVHPAAGPLYVCGFHATALRQSRIADMLREDVSS